MLMIIITKDGIIVDFGKPTMFIDDKDFETFLDNPKEFCIILLVIIKVYKKASANLLFNYILRKRLIEIEEPIAPIKIPNPKRPPTIIGTKTCGL